MNRLVPLTRGLARKAAQLAGVAMLVGAASSVALAADHRDGAGVQEMDNIPADINDVFAFMSGGKVVLGMTVFPAATAGSEFSDTAVYVWNVGRHPAFPAPADSVTQAMCAFNAGGDIECWIGDTEYIAGTAAEVGTEAGIASDSGKFKVYAGSRRDPFYFYLGDATGGFNGARTVVFNALNSLSFNPSGCPILDAATGAALRAQLVADMPTDNFFATLNTLAIVIEADADLFVDDDNLFFSVYASTHVKE